jgi:branched-chain amino acid transport system ATP-binding protein
MEAIRLEKVSKHFGGVSALRELSFQMQAGERLAVIGPNGAGKTTLINILDGQLFPSEGEIFLFGRNITRTPTHKRVHLGVGRSFQVTRLFGELTVSENTLLAFQGTRSSPFRMFRPMLSYKQIVQQSQELLSSWNMWDQRDQKVKALPYGNQRKLEMVLSLASNPNVLLLDEPSNGLTSEESQEIVSTLSRMPKEVSAIIVAHDMDLVFGASSRVMVLHNGRIIADGSPQRIRSDPVVRKIYMGSDDE